MKDKSEEFSEFKKVVCWTPLDAYRGCNVWLKIYGKVGTPFFDQVWSQVNVQIWNEIDER